MMKCMSISWAHARDMHVYHLHFLSVTFLFEVKVCKTMRKEIISVLTLVSVGKAVFSGCGFFSWVVLSICIVLISTWEPVLLPV